MVNENACPPQMSFLNLICRTGKGRSPLLTIITEGIVFCKVQEAIPADPAELREQINPLKKGDNSAASQKDVDEKNIISYDFIMDSYGIPRFLKKQGI